jgi:hypothetical protein
MSDKLDKWLNSPESDKYFDEIRRKHEIAEKRYILFENWVKDIDFNRLIDRLVNEHDENYIDACYKKGYEPYPNRKLNFLFKYLENKRIPVNVTELNCDFSNTIWFYKGYYFQIIFGQGSFIRIYRKSDLSLLLQV